MPPTPPNDENPANTLGLVARARAWAAGHPKRSLAIGLGFFASITAMLAAWILLAEIAAGPPPVYVVSPLTLARVLCRV